MFRHFFKFRKVFTKISLAPLLLISNNLDLAAKYLPNGKESIKKFEKNIFNEIFNGFEIKQKKNFLIAENKNINEESIK